MHDRFPHKFLGSKKLNFFPAPTQSKTKNAITLTCIKHAEKDDL